MRIREIILVKYLAQCLAYSSSPQKILTKTIKYMSGNIVIDFHSDQTRA